MPVGWYVPFKPSPNLTWMKNVTRVIGKAYIDQDRCIAWSDHQDCIVCEEMCPIPEKAIYLEEVEITLRDGSKDKIQLPHVERDKCIGCGICEYKCPVNGEAAIRVFVPEGRDHFLMTETSLHNALKNLYAGTKENREILVDGYQIDAIQGDTLVEIQTANFSAIKNKLATLLPYHPMLLVHPIALEKWIVQMPASGNLPLYRRKSPRRGRVEDLFRQLIYITDLLQHPNLQMEVVLVREEEVRRADGLGSWRRKGVSIIDRRLLAVISAKHFAGKQDFRELLPASLEREFSVQELACALSIQRTIAQKIVYCLRSMQIIHATGKRGRATLYALQNSAYNS